MTCKVTSHQEKKPFIGCRYLLGKRHGECRVRWEEAPIAHGIQFLSLYLNCY